MNKVRYQGCIAVQARQSYEESKWLLSLAKKHAFIQGVIGWVDLQHQAIDEHLDEFKDFHALKGVRHVVQDEPDIDFMLSDGFLNGISKLAEYSLIYEILIFPAHLPNTIKLVKQFPDQLFVLNHIAKPSIKNHEISQWAEDIQELSTFQNVHVKVSGIVTEADWKLWVPEDFTPYLDVVWESFGEDRIMLGSDWPVCLLAASYAQVMCLSEGYFEQFSPQVVNKIRGANAVEFYRL